MKCDSHTSISPSEVLSDKPLSTILLKDLLNVLDEGIQLWVELFKGCLLLFLIRGKFDGYRSLSKLRTEVDNSITLSHLNITFASYANFPSHKSGYGIRLHQKSVIPCQLWHKSTLGCWLNLRPFLHLNPFVLKFHATIAQHNPDHLSPSTTIKVQQLNFWGHFDNLE